MTSFADLAGAEHWIRTLDPVPALAGTTFAGGLVTVVHEPLDGARAVVFPGCAELVGTLGVAEVLERSAIDRVEILGGGTPGASDRLDTNDFVRPVWRGGELVLTVMPAADHRYVPFESRNPTPCCAAH